MILVNGTKGIGTGFSTEVLCYNPTEIIEYIRGRLMNGEFETSREFIPYYEGFNGSIANVDNGKFIVRGRYEIIGSDKVRITELPVGLWTDDFKEYIEKLTDSTDKNGKKITPIVKDYDDMSKDTTVDITITMTKGTVGKLNGKVLDTTTGVTELEKTLKLYTTMSTTNMHLFDAHDKLRKYVNPNDIIHDYFDTRMRLYVERKEFMIKQLERELVVLSNKHRYILGTLDGEIDLRRKKRSEITDMLKGKKFDMLDDDEDYKYLTKMSMDSVTEENVEKLSRQYNDKKHELEVLKDTTTEQMWSKELDELYAEYTNHRRQLQLSTGGSSEKKKVTKKVLIKKKST
jgi:DNA topoisomerase-2